ncbi:MAG: hypothetical protein R2749_07440 [Acidimicrobiales bacterium]
MRASIVSGPADLDHPPLAALLDRLRADGHPGLSERKRLDAAEPARGSFGVLCDDEDGHLVAYARCVPSRHPSPQWTMELLVHPHWRERVEPEVLAVLYVRLLTHGGGPLTWWTADPGQERLARASGWRIERTLARLVAPLPGTGGGPPLVGVAISPSSTTTPAGTSSSGSTTPPSANTPSRAGGRWRTSPDGLVPTGMTRRTSPWPGATLRPAGSAG